MPSLYLQLPPYISSSVPRIQKWKPLTGIPHQSLSIPRQIDRPSASSAKKIACFNDLVNGITKPKSVAEENDNLPTGLWHELMPNHVAVIMDGNGRWAQMRGLPVGAGYEAGVRAFRGLVELCCKWGIRVLTVFAFSADNLFRPKVS